MSREIELLTEIRDLLHVIAEKDLAKRDEKLRAELRKTVGKGKKSAGAIHQMDGTRTSAMIVRETGIDAGQLSRLINSLADTGLIGPDKKHPRLLFKIPPNFFDHGDESDE